MLKRIHGVWTEIEDKRVLSRPWLKGNKHAVKKLPESRETLQCWCKAAAPNFMCPWFGKNYVNPYVDKVMYDDGEVIE